MLNEFAYCPRLCYLEWVQGEFADSADTVEGRYQHRRVDKGRQRQKAGKAEQEEPEEMPKVHERSVYLTSDRLGMTAKIDLVEGEGTRVTPVDYKRGKRPHTPQGAWEPERVQVCAQGLILRDNVASLLSLWDSPAPVCRAEDGTPGGGGCGRRDDTVCERLSWSAGATPAGAGKGANEPEGTQISNVFRAPVVPDTGAEF